MGPNADIRVIINPASAAGKTRRRIPLIVRALRRSLPHRPTIFLTRSPGDAGRMAADAVRERATMVVAVGGDGTLHEVVNGMVCDAGGNQPGTALAIISAGSGEGFALSVALPRGLDDQVGLIAAGEQHVIDLGVITTFTEIGTAVRRYFVNECQVGIGADVVRNTRRMRKKAGGLVGYGLATFSALFRSPNLPLDVLLDGIPAPGVTFLGLSVGNGSRTGGGMALTPAARVDDGALDCLVIRGQSLLARVQSFPRIYTGGHVTSPWFSCLPFRRLEVKGEGDMIIAADGELVGRLPCSIEIVPHALRVIIPSRLTETHDGYENTYSCQA